MLFKLVPSAWPLSYHLEAGCEFFVQHRSIRYSGSCHLGNKVFSAKIESHGIFMHSSICRCNQCGAPKTQVQLESKNENLLTVTSHYTEFPIPIQDFPIEYGAPCDLLQFIVYNETVKWFAYVMEWESFKLHSLHGRDGHCRPHRHIVLSSLWRITGALCKVQCLHPEFEYVYCILYPRILYTQHTLRMRKWKRTMKTSKGTHFSLNRTFLEIISEDDLR